MYNIVNFEGGFIMKIFKLIAVTILATVMSFELSGCGPWGNKETQEESSQEQEGQMSEQNTEEDSKESNQTNSIEKEEESIVNSKKDPVDIVLDAKEKVLSANEIDFTRKDLYNMGEENLETEDNYRIKPGEIYLLRKTEQKEASEVIMKGDYSYYSIFDSDNALKIKGKVDDGDISKLYESTKEELESILKVFSRENIKELKEESNDGSKKTYLVELNNKDDIKGGSDAVNVDDVKIKVVINDNGTLSEVTFADVKMTGEEKTITVSRSIIVNAIGSDVAAIEAPEDADSYKEFDPNEESDEDDIDEEDLADEEEKEE